MVQGDLAERKQQTAKTQEPSTLSACLLLFDDSLLLFGPLAPQGVWGRVGASRLFLANGAFQVPAP